MTSQNNNNEQYFNYFIIRINDLKKSSSSFFGKFSSETEAFEYLKNDKSPIYKYINLPKTYEYRVQSSPPLVTVVEKGVKGWVTTGDVEIYKLSLEPVTNYKEKILRFPIPSIMKTNPSVFQKQLEEAIEKRRKSIAAKQVITTEQTTEKQVTMEPVEEQTSEKQVITTEQKVISIILETTPTQEITETKEEESSSDSDSSDSDSDTSSTSSDSDSSDTEKEEQDEIQLPLNASH